MNHEALDMIVETRDVNKRFVLIAAASLLALLIAGVLVTWFIYHEPIRKNLQDLQTYDLSTFPKPQLQAYPREDLAQLRAREEKTLTTYGRQENHVRLPIDRALELAAKKHLIPTEEGAHAP